MNPRERFLAIFSDTERKKLDRVPTFVQGVLSGFIQQNETALFDNFDGDLTCDPGFDAPLVLGFDSKFGSVPGAFTNDPIILLDKEGNKFETGVNATVGKEGSTYYNKGLLWCPENLEKIQAALHPVNNPNTIKQHFNHYDNLSKVICPVPFMGGIFDTMWMGMGMGDFSKHYRQRSKFYLDVIKLYGDMMLTTVEKVIETTKGQAKMICIGDDVAFKGRPMISPERWEQDIGPYYKKYAQMCKEVDIVPLMHTDGDITTLVPAFQNVGIRGVQGWEGGADPVYINEHYPDFVVIGFGDVSRVLPFGSPDEIDQHVKSLMDVLKANRHYIFGPSTVIVKEMPIKNVQIFMESARKYGKY